MQGTRAGRLQARSSHKYILFRAAKLLMKATVWATAGAGASVQKATTSTMPPRSHHIQVEPDVFQVVFAVIAILIVGLGRGGVVFGSFLGADTLLLLLLRTLPT